MRKRKLVWSLQAMMLVLMLVVSPAYSMDSLKDFDGNKHSLGDFTGKGKWTVVMIWASDCGVCNAEAENYVKFNKAHKDKDAYILGISMDGDERILDAEAFIDRHGVDFQNLIGEPENVAGIYSDLTGRQWIGTPTFLFFNPQGELRAAQVGAVPTNLIEDFMAKETEAASSKSAN